MTIGLAVGGVGVVVGARAALQGDPCRPTSVGLSCHLDAIVVMGVIDLAIVSALLLVAARRCPDG